MLEIPGEEAPTDPGAQMRARLEAEEKVKARSRRTRKIAMAALAAMAMVGVGIAGTAYLQALQEAQTYDLPDDYYQPTPLETVAQVENPVAPTTPGTPEIAGPKTPKTEPKANTPETNPNAGHTQPTDAAIAKVEPGAHPRNTEDALAPEISLKSGENGIPSIGSAKLDGGFGKLLSDDSEIFEMAKSVVEKYRPQLNGCFESATRSAPDLRGSWTVSFTIEPGGTTKNVSVKPVGKSDSNFEQCAAKRVASWKFLKIDHDFNVRKKYNFDPQG